MQHEVWKEILGFEGLYEISNLGNARSLDKIDSIGRKVKGKSLISQQQVCRILRGRRWQLAQAGY